MTHDARRKAARGAHQFGVRHHLIDQSDLQCPGWRERVAGQQQFKRALAAGETRQPLRSAECGRHAEIDLGLGEQRLIAGDGEMHGFGDLAAPAEGDAVHRRDHRLAERLQPRRHRLATPDEIAHGGVRAELHAL
mgnify:CR=1 FL=1